MVDCLLTYGYIEHLYEEVLLKKRWTDWHLLILGKCFFMLLLLHQKTDIRYLTLPLIVKMDILILTLRMQQYILLTQ